MKKVLSVLAVVALIFALSVSAFADGEAAPSVQYTTPDVTATYTTPDVDSDSSETPEGTMVDVTKAEALDAAEEAALSAAVEALDSTGDGQAVAAEIFQVELLEGKPGDEMMGLVSDKVTAENPITVVFVRSADDATVIGVLAQNAEGGWDSMAFDASVPGQVSVTFTHLCTVAFLTSVESDNNTVKPTTNTTKPSGGQPGSKPGSPATGYNTTVWVVMTAVLVLAAGVCFVSARKKVKE